MSVAWYVMLLCSKGPLAVEHNDVSVVHLPLFKRKAYVQLFGGPVSTAYQKSIISLLVFRIKP